MENKKMLEDIVKDMALFEKEINDAGDSLLVIDRLLKKTFVKYPACVVSDQKLLSDHYMNPFSEEIFKIHLYDHVVEQTWVKSKCCNNEDNWLNALIKDDGKLFKAIKASNLKASDLVDVPTYCTKSYFVVGGYADFQSGCVSIKLKSINSFSFIYISEKGVYMGKEVNPEGYEKYTIGDYSESSSDSLFDVSGNIQKNAQSHILHIYKFIPQIKEALSNYHESFKKMLELEGK